VTTERTRMRPPRTRQRVIRGASEQVAVQIQHYIQEEGLRPGDFLGREEDLAAEFGVSRPTLREALKMMLETGSVTLEELLDARLLLEVPLAGLAAYQADEQNLTRLRDAVHAGASAADPQALATVDSEIHQAVAEAAGNRMLQALTGWVFEVVQPSVNDALHGAIVQSAIVEQHEALLAAIEKGDAPRAERAMKDHLLYLRDVLRMVREQPEA
jgi:GntR family transcriptional repressor for pyruvate dehydrogenase complex